MKEWLEESWEDYKILWIFGAIAGIVIIGLVWYYNNTYVESRTIDSQVEYTWKDINYYTTTDSDGHHHIHCDTDYYLCTKESKCICITRKQFKTLRDGEDIKLKESKRYWKSNDKYINTTYKLVEE